MSQPKASDEKPGRDGGLVDPRVIHPSPEGVFSDAAELPEKDAVPARPIEQATPEEGVRGIVDPRSEAAGPRLY